MFIKLSKLICDLFPTENERTFFAIQDRNYTGKLYSSYRSYRKKIIDIESSLENESSSSTSILHGISLITDYTLNTVEDLRNLVDHEVRFVSVKYLIDNQLDNAHREVLAQIIISTVFKKGPTKQ